MRLPKTISILSATALALGTAIPAFAEAPTPSSGEQTGTGKTTLKIIVDGTEYGGTEDADNPNSTGQEGQAGYDADAPGTNIAFTAPTELDFVVKANGDMLCPSETATAIHNESVYGIHVSSVDVDAPSGWNLVTDSNFASSTAANTVSMNFGPATDDNERLSISSCLTQTSIANGLAKWGMSAKGTDNNKDKLFLSLDGKAKNLNAGYGSYTEFASIHWYLTSGGEGVKYIPPADRVTITKAATTNGTFKIADSASSSNEISYAAENDRVYIIATPSEGYKASSMTVTKVSDSSTIAVTRESGSNVGYFTMPAGEVNVGVAFEEAIPALNASMFANNDIDGLKAAANYITGTGSSDTAYINAAKALVGQTISVALNSGQGNMTARLVSVDNTRGLTFEAVDILTNAQMNSTETTSGGWAASALRTSMNSGDIYNTYFSSSALAGKVRQVTNTSYSYGGSTNSSSDYYWVPSANNIFGAGWMNNVAYDDGDAQFDYYAAMTSLDSTGNNAGTVKNYNSSADDWWLRSAAPVSDRAFMLVGDHGFLSGNGAHFSLGVAPCFCL